MVRVIDCRSGVVATMAAALFLVAATGARAQEAGDGGAEAATRSAAARSHAQELLQRGNDLFRAGNFAEALRAYGDAHREFPSPKLFFNIARCEESLGHRPEALENLHAFLRQAPEADPLIRAEAEKRMADLAAALAALDVSALPANAAIAVDGRTVGLTPLDRPIWMEPGAHRVTVERAGKALWVTTLEGSAGATAALQISDTSPTAPVGSQVTESQPPPPRPPVRSRWWIWVGVGLVLAGAATVMAVKLTECPATTCK
jgi:hypothetical protein